MKGAPVQRTPQQILDEIEDLLEREGHLKAPPDPPEPPRRVVELGPLHQAVFLGEPTNELVIYKAEADAPLELPYFDPTGYTDHELVEKLKLYEKLA